MITSNAGVGSVSSDVLKEHVPRDFMRSTCSKMGAFFSSDWFGSGGFWAPVITRKHLLEGPGCFFLHGWMTRVEKSKETQ